MVVRPTPWGIQQSNHGRDVRFGTGVADLQKLLFEVDKQEPPPQEEPNKGVNCSRPYGGTKPTTRCL